jgi:cell filamentation protein
MEGSSVRALKFHRQWKALIIRRLREIRVSLAFSGNMAAPTRYDVANGTGGNADGILENKLGLTSQEDLDAAETNLLHDSFSKYLARLYDGGLDFNLALIYELHLDIFGPLYDWAGQTRVVNMSKDGVTFAAVQFMGQSLESLRTIIETSIPNVGEGTGATAHKLALIHNEFNAVHPFREGNGRTIRLFMDLLVVGLCLSPIRWNSTNYLAACRDGMNCEHGPMERLMLESFQCRIDDPCQTNPTK